MMLSSHPQNRSTQGRHQPATQRMIQQLTVLGAVLLGCLLSQSASALPSDREQPIRIQSNTAERDEKSGLTTYQGNVEMTQGTLRIQADSVTIHSKDNKVTHVIALGSPARYEQQPETGKALVKAAGNTIKYFVSSEKLHLLEQASINQDGAIMKGERIDYDIQSSLMKAGNTDQPTRVEMVIPPSVINQTNGSTQE